MFETVAPEKFAKRSRKAVYEALPLSIAFHAVIGVAVLVAHVWDVNFPGQSPAQVMSFSLTEIPPPPPPPPPPPKAKAAPAVVVKKIEIPTEVLAPTIIPESIPEIRPESMVASVAPPDASDQGVEGGIEGGEIGGIFGGVSGGDIGGVIGGVQGSVVADTNTVTIERDRPLPMYPLSQVYPSYPEEARLRGWEDQLVVRYVIGTNGRVREVTVISPPERTMFAEPTVKAIRNWRFRPLIKDGEKKEVVHELTVFYRLHQQS